MMSKEEFKARKDGKDEDEVEEIITSSLPARDFIMNRGKEIIKVPIKGPDGLIEIEIRARLTKGEVKNHQKFLEIFTNPDNVDDELAEKVTASFLSAITLDGSLNKEFWLSEDIDPYIAQELVMAFLKKSAETLGDVKKFRQQ